MGGENEKLGGERNIGKLEVGEKREMRYWRKGKLRKKCIRERVKLGNGEIGIRGIGGKGNLGKRKFREKKKI